MEGTMTGQPLDDDYWHVTEYYENIRTKIMNMNQTLGRCPEIGNNDELPLRLCNTPMNGRTQYTPRADFDGASLTSILKPAPNGYIPKNELKPLYEGPDVHNPAYDIPDDQIDVLSIAMGRRRHRHLSEHHHLGPLPYNQSADVTKEEDVDVESTAAAWLTRKFENVWSMFRGQRADTQVPEMRSMDVTSQSTVRRRLDEEIVPGEGWDVAMEPQGHCDGTYDSVCAHETHEECFLMGHPDGRGAVVGTEWSGWLVMTLKALKQGIIVIKLQTWHLDVENPKTRRWNSVNAKRRLGSSTDAAVEVQNNDTEYFMGDLAYPEIDTTSETAAARIVRF
jgi:hypothetical protein